MDGEASATNYVPHPQGGEPRAGQAHEAQEASAALVVPGSVACAEGGASSGGAMVTYVASELPEPAPVVAASLKEQAPGQDDAQALADVTAAPDSTYGNQQLVDAASAAGQEQPHPLPAEAEAEAPVAATADSFPPAASSTVPAIAGGVDTGEAKCREFFDTVTAWPSDDQYIYLSGETGRAADDLRRWFEDTRAASAEAAEEQQRRAAAAAAAVQAGEEEVRYDPAAAVCAAAAAAVAAAADEHRPTVVADVTHAAVAAGAAAAVPSAYEHHHHRRRPPHDYAASTAEGAAAARSRSRSRLQEYRAKCLLFFETVTAWPDDGQLKELSSDTGRSIDQLRRWFYQARHQRYKMGEMSKDRGTRSAAAAAGRVGVEGGGEEGGAAVAARPGIPHVVMCRELFKENKYPNPSQMRDLSRRTGRTVEQLRKWFYKERYEAKRRSLDSDSAKEGADTEAAAAAAAPESFEMDTKEYNKFLRAYLENETAYPDEEAIAELAVKTGRPQDTIRRWFYKTRHKIRKEGGSLLGAPPDEDRLATYDLRKSFYDNVTKYPSRDQLDELCRATGKTTDQMRRWFEKQRHRERSAELERMGEGGADDADGGAAAGTKRAKRFDFYENEDHPPTPEERAAYIKILSDFFSDVTQWPSDDQIRDLSSKTGRTFDQLRRWFYKTRHAAYRKDGLVHSPKPVGPLGKDSAAKFDARKEFFDNVTQHPTKEQLTSLVVETGYTEEQLKRYFYKMRYKVRDEARKAAEEYDETDKVEGEIPECSAEAVAILKEFLDSRAGGGEEKGDRDGKADADADAPMDPTEEQVSSLAEKTGLASEQVREWLLKTQKRQNRQRILRRVVDADGRGTSSRHPPDAVKAFEAFYSSVTKYPNAEALAELAMQTGRNPSQVRKWFERKRFRDRKDGREAMELEGARRARMNVTKRARLKRGQEEVGGNADSSQDATGEPKAKKERSVGEKDEVFDGF